MDPDLTVELQCRRLDAQIGSTARGENAFMSIVLKSTSSENTLEFEKFRVEDGLLIGMTGFNTFSAETRKCEDGNEKGVLVGDTGVLIDHHFVRNGYAKEALQAVFEYGFGELGEGEMFWRLMLLICRSEDSRRGLAWVVLRRMRGEWVWSLAWGERNGRRRGKS